MTRTYSQKHHTDKYSQLSSINLPIWLNGSVFVYKLSGSWFNTIWSHLKFTVPASLEQIVCWESANCRVWVNSGMRTSHDKNIQSRHRTDKYPELSTIIWLDCLNSCVFNYKLSCCGFQSSSTHLPSRFCTSSKQEFSWHSGNYRVWIHSETRTWHDTNIQSKAPYR